MKINVQIDTETKAMTITKDGEVIDPKYFAIGKYMDYDKPCVGINWSNTSNGVTSGASVSFKQGSEGEAQIVASTGDVAKKVGETIKRSEDAKKVSAAVSSLFNSNGHNLTEGLDPTGKKLAKELYPGAEGV